MERQTKELQEKIDQMRDEIAQLDLDIEENQGMQTVSLGAVTVEGSALGSKPRLFPYKLSVWPACGTVLTGGRPGDSSLIYLSNDCKAVGRPSDLSLLYLSNDCNLLDWISADIFCHQWPCITVAF